MRREALLFCLAAAARITYLLISRPDVDSPYWALSESLVRAGALTIDGVPNTDFEPLYPLFLAAARLIAQDRVIVVQVLQIAVASAGAVFLYRLAFTLSGLERVGAISAALYAIHPLLIRQAGAPSDLSLAATTVVAFAYSFVTIRSAGGAAVAGICLGLAILTRAMVLPLLVCGAILLLLRRRPAFAVAFVLSAVLLVAPFAFRSYHVGGSWWPTRSGMNLFIGNSPYTASLFPDDDLDLLEEPASGFFERARPDVPPSSADYDAELDQFLTRRALAYMMEDPLRTIRAKLLNAAYFFSPRLVPLYITDSSTRVAVGTGGEIVVEDRASRPRMEIVAHAVAASFVLGTALVGVYLRRRDLRGDAMLWCVLATFVAVHAVYVPATRYTAPTLFVLLFYSSVALEGVRPYDKNSHRV
jgi:hypothetical protein